MQGPSSPLAGFADAQSAEWHTGSMVPGQGQGRGATAGLSFVPKHQAC